MPTPPLHRAQLVLGPIHSNKAHVARAHDARLRAFAHLQSYKGYAALTLHSVLSNRLRDRARPYDSIGAENWLLGSTPAVQTLVNTLNAGGASFVALLLPNGEVDSLTSLLVRGLPIAVEAYSWGDLRHDFEDCKMIDVWKDNTMTEEFAHAW